MYSKKTKLHLFLPLFFLVFCFLISNKAVAEINQPKTLEESKNFIAKAIDILVKEMPGKISEIWRNQVLPIWQKMWDWFSNFWKKNLGDKIGSFWYDFIKPKINYFLDKIRTLLGQTIEKNQPIVEKELQKGEEGIKKNLPPNTRGYLDKFKDLFK